MDPIGGQVAAEIRSVEQQKPARPVQFRYKRARAEIKKAQERLASVKREARGTMARSCAMSDERAFLEQVDALRVEFRSPETTDDRRWEVRRTLHNLRPRLRSLRRAGVKSAPSLSAQLLLPALKAQMRAMMLAWATIRAIEVESGLNQDPSIQLLPLANGKWARLKLPEGDRVLRWDTSPALDIEVFRSWGAWNYLKADAQKVNLFDDFDEPIDGNLVDTFITSWMIRPKAKV